MRFTQLFLAACCLTTVAHADLMITFADGDSFEGDTTGSMAGPFLDAATGTVGNITTLAVGPAGAVLNPNAGTLGINAVGSGDTAGAFDDEELWAFSWDVDSQFTGIDFVLGDDETFAIGAADWIGLTLTPGSSAVSFDSLTGTFTISNGHTLDDFDLDDLTGGVALDVLAGSFISIGFETTGAAGNSAVISDISFALPAAVPEPGSMALCLCGAGVVVLRRRKRATRSRVDA